MARSGTVRFFFDTLRPGLEEFPEKLERALSASHEFDSNQGQNYMKIAAPWTDRTGNARASLTAKPFREPGRFITILYGTMPYQIYLEKSNNGKYAIIGPSTGKVGRMIMQGFSGVMRRMT